MKHLLALACTLAVVAGAGVFLYNQTADADMRALLAERPYQVHMTDAEVNDPDFVLGALHGRLAAGDNTKLLFGSSELRPVPQVTTHPANVFGQNNYGMDTMTLGRPFFQDLWQAVEIGALDQEIPDGKLVLFLGIQWFMTYQDPEGENFRWAFSPASMERFMANPRLSEETKAAVRAQALRYGIDESLLVEPGSFDLPARIDGAVSELFDSGERDAAVMEDATNPDSDYGYCEEVPRARLEGEAQVPNWDEWMAYAEQEAARQSTNNDEGFMDSYYTDSYPTWLSDAKATYEAPEGAEYWETEWTDFLLVLQVCKELDIEPLIVIMPTKGVAYDQTAYTREVREIFYERVRQTCAEWKVPYVDFSDHEYDKYFLRDVMHLGWTGWVHANKAIYEFFNGDRSADSDIVWPAADASTEAAGQEGGRAGAPQIRERAAAGADVSGHEDASEGGNGR